MKQQSRDRLQQARSAHDHKAGKERSGQVAASACDMFESLRQADNRNPQSGV